MGYTNIETDECCICARRDVAWACDCGKVICSSVYCKTQHDLDHAPDEPTEDERGALRES